MLEKIISLGNIDPIELYGINNSKLDKIKKYFPKLKIVARGNEIKALGEEMQIIFFEKKILEFLKHINTYNILPPEKIEDIILGSDTQIKGASNVDDNVIIFGNNGKIIKAQTHTQIDMLRASLQYDLMFAIGPAGTGKTYTAIALAVKALKNREVKRIILSRPAVEAGESLGFLPGDMKEKLDPYLQALYDGLNDMIPPKKLKDMLEDRIVQIAPLAYMRGRTLSNAFVILDEAQNATVNQLKMFLTRMGRNAKFIITGDVTQIDLPNKNNSGLLQCQQILRGIKGIKFLLFDEKDIIRHRLVKEIVKAYDNVIVNRKKEKE
ncbi:MAG: phosphate starvation-inducible protein PhoH [Bacteroidia bacterium]|nr:MAG: phosphate starvation-inducible protein PhoH [Bacteroidia bacterium]